MNITTILQEQKEPDGTYAAVKFDDKTNQAIERYIKDNSIPNGTATAKLHTTLLYSRKYLPNFESRGEIKPPLTGTPDHLEVWDTQPDEDGHRKRCLVLKYKCPELIKRHKALMDEHGATYDFDEYVPHITLSYDIGDMDEKVLPKVDEWLPEIVIVDEYGEDLNLNWAKDSTKKDEE